MEIAVKTLFAGWNPEIMSQKQRIGFHARVPYYHGIGPSIPTIKVAQENCRRFYEVPISAVRTSHRILSVVHAASSDLENVNVSKSPFKDFAVATETCQDREIKMRIDVSGAKTQAIFDDVFSKLADAAQPIPGFRRVKGGKTPDIPKDILLHILGPSKVHMQSIKKIINSTVAEYVEKEGLEVTKDLRVEQSFEELEAAFVPGKEFGFDAIIQLQKTE